MPDDVRWIRSYVLERDGRHRRHRLHLRGVEPGGDPPPRTSRQTCRSTRSSPSPTPSSCGPTRSRPRLRDGRNTEVRSKQVVVSSRRSRRSDTRRRLCGDERRRSAGVHEMRPGNRAEPRPPRAAEQAGATRSRGDARLEITAVTATSRTAEATIDRRVRKDVHKDGHSNLAARRGHGHSHGSSALARRLFRAASCTQCRRSPLAADRRPAPAPVSRAARVRHREAAPSRPPEPAPGVHAWARDGEPQQARRRRSAPGCASRS